MIENQQQYEATAEQISRLEVALEVSYGEAKQMDSRVSEAMIAGIQSQIEELRHQLRDFDHCDTVLE